MRWVIFILSCVYTSAVFSQDVEADIIHLGGVGNDRGEELIKHSNGDIFIVGTTGSAFTGNSDILLTRLNSSFSCVWSMALGGFSTDNGKTILECPNGDILIGGFTNEPGDYDARIMRISYDGDIIWNHVYGSQGWNFIRRILNHPDGGYVAIGETNSNADLQSNGWLIHFDESGIINQEISFGGGAEETFIDAFFANSGEILICGSSDQNSSNAQGWILCLTAGYEFLWEDYLEEVFPSAFIAGALSETGVRCTANIYADYIWSRTLLYSMEGDLIEESATDIGSDYEMTDIIDVGFGFLLVGNQNAYGLGASDAMIQQWNNNPSWMVGPTFGTPWTEEIKSGILTDDGELFFVGTSYMESQEFDEQVMIIHWPADSLQSQFSITTQTIECSPEFYIGLNNIETSELTIVMQGESIIVQGIPNEYSQLSVYDISGRICHMREIWSSVQQIDLGLENGVYLIEMSCPGCKTMVEKILIR